MFFETKVSTDLSASELGANVRCWKKSLQLPAFHCTLELRELCIMRVGTDISLQFQDHRTLYKPLSCDSHLPKVSLIANSIPTSLAPGRPFRAVRSRAHAPPSLTPSSPPPHPLPSAPGRPFRAVWSVESCSPWPPILHYNPFPLLRAVHLGPSAASLPLPPTFTTQLI